jgi:hypothetical protein
MTGVISSDRNKSSITTTLPFTSTPNPHVSSNFFTLLLSTIHIPTCHILHPKSHNHRYIHDISALLPRLRSNTSSFPRCAHSDSLLAQIINVYYSRILSVTETPCLRVVVCLLRFQIPLEIKSLLSIMSLKRK